MKKNYTKPHIRVTHFKVRNLICTSSMNVGVQNVNQESKDNLGAGRGNAIWD